MADFKEVHQKADQSTQQFEQEVANWVGNGYHTVSGFADPEGKRSWVQMEKTNKSPSSGGKSSLISE